MNNPVDAVPFDVIERFIHMWRSRAKESTPRTREAYSLMAYAAETILEGYKAVHKLEIKMPEAKTISFKKWKMFEEEGENIHENHE